MNVLIVSMCNCGFVHDSPLIDCFELAQAVALYKAGNDVRVLALDLRSFRRLRKWGQGNYVVNTMPVFTVSWPAHGFGACFEQYMGKRAAIAAFQNATRDGWHPDVIHAHFTEMGYYVADVAAGNGIPLVITEHSSLMNTMKVDERTLDLAKYAYSKADRLIAVGHRLAKNMNANTGCSARVIPNMVDLSVFSPSRFGGTERDGLFRFVSAGNLIESKGFDCLLRAFARIEAPDAVLTIFGDGPLRERLAERSKQLGVEDRVTFMGRCPPEQLAEEYARSNCFILTSQTETFGVAYIEAMAMGLPVIATRCGGPEDFVTEKDGLLISVGDAEAAANAMAYMRDNGERYDGADIRERTVISVARYMVPRRRIWEKAVRMLGRKLFHVNAFVRDPVTWNYQNEFRCLPLTSAAVAFAKETDLIDPVAHEKALSYATLQRLVHIYWLASRHQISLCGERSE